jgi:hypothetical protein
VAFVMSATAGFSALLVVVGTACPDFGRRADPVDYTVENGTEETVVLTIRDPGRDETVHSLPAGTSRGFFFGDDDFIRDGHNCDDLDLVARTRDGDPIQRHDGPICGGFVWTVE